MNLIRYDMPWPVLNLEIDMTFFPFSDKCCCVRKKKYVFDFSSKKLLCAEKNAVRFFLYIENIVEISIF